MKEKDGESVIDFVKDLHKAKLIGVDRSKGKDVSVILKLKNGSVIECRKLEPCELENVALLGEN